MQAVKGILAALMLLPTIVVAETLIIPHISYESNNGSSSLVAQLTATEAATAVTATMTVERRSTSGSMNTSQSRTLDLAQDETAQVGLISLNDVEGQTLVARLVVSDGDTIIAQTMLILGGE